MQMTAAAISLNGASPTSEGWDSINWKIIETEIERLQMRIAKAICEGLHGKVKSLQWILTHSFHAKLMPLKRVV
jgi:RNA-directed DNA polymerase